MQKLTPALVAEAIGTFGLCFVGIMAIHVHAIQHEAGLISVALAHGLILAIMISIFAATSGGHLNPAVTLGLLAGGKIKGGPAVGYIIAQCIGGILAGFAVMAIFPQDPKAADFGRTIVLQGTPAMADGSGITQISLIGGCIAEAIATFFLVTAVWGTAVDPRAPKIGGFGIGLTVAADILAIGPLTGAAMNPARAFGPAVAATIAGGHYDWANHWVYWIGPVAGGVLASVIYRFLIMKDVK
ncbi:MAG TPA: aquaporin [Phycisphaerae bacterium]|jgi:aquaporin Z